MRRGPWVYLSFLFRMTMVTIIGFGLFYIIIEVTWQRR